ncbi:hypothetical protein Dsin_006474 [Dipteronia sinensis]|uniref:Nodulin-like domain-containing protein n=1 Tax=Dipteronia sinensis TaxID=43782 RepID=A0AAE0EG67_9ROSI|nr:hypothetical protein Dsin_006474 [Dipteronia sinensis]
MVMSEFNESGTSWRVVKSFVLHVLGGRWFMVFAALLILSVNGSSYMFGLYSNDLKSELGYDQTTLNMISFFKDLGGNLGVLAGLTYEVAPPWVVLLIGSIMNFFGFFMMWLSVTDRVSKPHVWKMCLYMWIGTNSLSFPNTGSLVTCVKNFPESRGLVIGLLKGLIGLSEILAPQAQERPNFWTMFGLKSIFKQPERGEDYAILQAIFSIDMLILFTATTCGVGGALTTIDNLGQIAKSLGYPTHTIGNFISLISIWNFLGRVLAGLASEILLIKYKCPRPLLLTLVILVSCIGHLLIAFGVPNSLYFSSIIIGFCLGAELSLTVAIISEIFGLKHYSTLYNVGSISSPVGSYIFNVRVAGRLYDRAALKQMEALGLTRKAGKGLTCTGVQCYKMVFIIISAATLFGCLVSSVLVLRTEKFYKGDTYQKFREEGLIKESDLVLAENRVVESKETEAKAANGITSNSSLNSEYQPANINLR